MSAQLAENSKYSSVEVIFARNIAKKAANHPSIRSEYVNFGGNKEQLEELIANSLLRTCAPTKTERVAENSAILGNRRIQRAPTVSQSDFIPDASAASSIFPLDFNISAGIAGIDIRVNNPSFGRYVVDVTSKVFGCSLGTSQLSFDNGTLTRTENVSVGPAELNYTVSLDFSNGFNLHFIGKATFDLLFVHEEATIGPYDFNI
ncbi:hypothetical protein [Burkholderia cepacia]|uniref:hypothetical protein n=1 Tax=Burkholderia cepacia TaxID=292 RepID=UPI003528298A